MKVGVLARRVSRPATTAAGGSRNQLEFGSAAEGILRLQRQAGNRAVLRLIGPAVQRKSAISPENPPVMGKQADPVVQTEALTRLREYRATLDPAHQRLWKTWLDRQLANAAKDTTGRRDFLTRLSAFVV